TTPLATSTASAARASEARWWRLPSRARRSSVPIRLIAREGYRPAGRATPHTRARQASPLRIGRIFELDPSGLGAAARGDGVQAVDPSPAGVDVQLAVDDDRVPAVDGHRAPQAQV